MLTTITIRRKARRPASALSLSALVAASLLPGVTAAVAQRIENPVAVFNGLDKITGRIVSFEVAIGETVQFGALQLTPRACYTRPATETPNTTAFLEVDEVSAAGRAERLFTGWVFAASPGLHGIEHPVYDIWLTDCENPAAAAAAPSGAPGNGAPDEAGGVPDPDAPPLPPARPAFPDDRNTGGWPAPEAFPEEPAPLQDPLFAPIGN